ncbi:MAG: hypothetical protein OEW15_16970 [Nitrospirota bacterium]|nr:hypothetical protein [Nitrospirota bacterium]
MKKGDIVKFKETVDVGDEKVRMRLLEDPDGGRVLVEALVGMQLNPTYVYQVKDLVECGEPVLNS